LLRTPRVSRGHAPRPDVRDLRLGFAIEVDDIEAIVTALRSAGAKFRNEIVTRFGGKQILVDDPSGNPIELFQPTRPEAKLGS
jgi:extradiol dioxygenase family protein